MAPGTKRPRTLDPKTNALLAKLNPEDYLALMTHAKIVPLKVHQRVYRQDQDVRAVYFPLTALISVLVTSDGAPQMEMAVIGREGVLGASELIRDHGAMALNMVQIAGSAVQIDATVFRKLVESRPAVKDLIDQHLYALLRQILQGAACNRIHNMEERCARSLLMTHDRAGSDTFPLTQEFMSHMLGVRRATINVATGILKKAGFIHFVRGQVTVTDRPGLESAACACYQTIVRAYAPLLPTV